MPMLTAAADIFAAAPQEWYDLPKHVRILAEGAYRARAAWELLDECESVSRREGRHDDGHDLRSPEQATYLAWQAAELAYQQITGRLNAAKPTSELPLHRRLENYVLAHPQATIMDLMAEFDLSDDEVRDELEHVRRGDRTTPEPAPEIDDPEEQLARVAHLPRPAGVSFGPIDPDFF